MTRRSSRYAFLDHPGPLAFAHRGAHEEADENTLAAFEAATRLGYRHIETDVQATRDGVAVLFHGAPLNRLFDAPGRVQDYNWTELSRLRTKGGDAPARLDEALASFPGARFNIDAKTEAAVAPMAEAVARCEALDRVCIASSNDRRIQLVRRLLRADTCWSPGRSGVFGLRLAGWGLPGPPLRFPAAQIPLHYGPIPLATRRLVEAAHARGVQVHVWTIDDPAEMERLLDLGADGLITDRPRALKEVLQRRGEWHG